MEGLVKAIFGQEASEDKDIIRLYEDCQKLAMIEVIKFTSMEIAATPLNDEDAESILKDYSNQYK